LDPFGTRHKRRKKNLPPFSFPEKGCLLLSEREGGFWVSGERRRKGGPVTAIPSLEKKGGVIKEKPNPVWRLLGISQKRKGKEGQGPGRAAKKGGGKGPVVSLSSDRKGWSPLNQQEKRALEGKELLFIGKFGEKEGRR